MSFRVTSEEYQQLQQASEGSGNGNLSEFARLEMLNRARSRMEARANVAKLEQRLSNLRQAIGVTQPVASELYRLTAD